MIFFDGTYRLQRRKDFQTDTSVRKANAWRLRIINLTISQPEVKHLKPIIVVATHTGEGIFHTTCAESLGKRVCRDFNLDVKELLWIEHFPDRPERMYVATFKLLSYSGHENYYSIGWRPIRSNEVDAIRPFIPEAEDIDTHYVE